MLRKILADIVALFSPRECAVCGDVLASGEEFICTACRFRVPLTGFVEQTENPMKERLSALMPIENASALFYFIADSDWRRTIHELKYYRRWSHAGNLGVWFGHVLRNSGNYDDVDVIVPVPLHPNRLLKRGYNQSDYIAEGVASVLGVRISRRVLVRKLDGESQTHHSRNERWGNVEGAFEVRRADQLAGLHVLLVDDVFTTGATVAACCEAILAACRDVRISVATLAVSQKEFGFDR